MISSKMVLYFALLLRSLYVRGNFKMNFWKRIYSDNMLNWRSMIKGSISSGLKFHDSASHLHKSQTFIFSVPIVNTTTNLLIIRY